MKRYAVFLFSFLGVAGCLGKDSSWASHVLQRDIPYRVVHEPKGGELVTIVRLVGLAGEGASEESSLRAEVLASQAGYRVIELDYSGAEEAAYPGIAQDIAKLRDDIFRAELFSDLDLDTSRIFVLPEGYVLKTDVHYFADPERPLAMDIAYPVDATSSTPCVLEFSCDNANRMGNFSLAVCRDTLLEGLAIRGYAIAMADHPVPPPYKGIDTMPDCGLRIKAAVRTLRGVGAELGLSNRIGVVGFSRGSGMALFLATTKGLEQFEGQGEWGEVDSSIQAGVILSGRFTYLDLLEGDRMLPRYEKAWGRFADYPKLWREQGALDYLAAPTIPLFMSINSGEGPDAQHQMSFLRERLARVASPYQFIGDSDDAGHKVPIDPTVLEAMEEYLSELL